MAQRPPIVSPQRRVIFTIVSANYIAYAATLMQSVRRFHPEARRVIVLADGRQAFPGLDLAAELRFCEDLGCPRFANMALWYAVIEFNTAIKPYCFLHFLDQGAQTVCYLDPDIQLHAPLRAVFRALRKHDCVLTPHTLSPLQDGKEPSDLTIMKSGVYNLGFFAVRDTNESRALLRWWADRCYVHCRVDIPGHMFTDQRWMDMAPSFVPRPCILRHPGYNVAYWNLLHRPVHSRDKTWWVGRHRLVFFHFSGIVPHDPAQFSIHQNRFTVETLGAGAALCAAYRRRVLANGWQRFRHLPYAFARFPDCRPIEGAMRRWLLRAIDERVIDPQMPLAIASDFFDHVDPAADANGASLTRFMHQFWLDRSDLRAAFDIFSADGLDAYFNWFLSDAGQQGVEARTVAAARALRAPEPQGAGRPIAAAPPWSPVSREAWTGPAADLTPYLAEDIALGSDLGRVLVPRQIALLWERRHDLQRHFPLADVAGLGDYIAWALTDGAIEGSVVPRLLSPAFVRMFTELSDLGAHYGDVPITWGMLATRAVDRGRGGLGLMRGFPTERVGRMAHGLWFAFVAPAVFDWPAEMVAPVRAYFDAATTTEVDGLRLSRAALALWEALPGAQRHFTLSTPASRWSYCRWLVLDALPRLGLTVDQFDPRLRPFLAQRSPRVPGLARVLEMVHAHEPDLGRRFDLRDPGQVAAFRAWGQESLMARYPQLAVGRPEPPRLARRRVALAGFWSSPTGRGEDVRCYAAALRTVGFSDFAIVDLGEGKLLDHDGRDLLVEGAPATGLRVEANVCAVNADTAFADWARLRQLNVRAHRMIGSWAWELDRLPRHWRHAFSFYDEIWSATAFADQAFRAAAARPVRLVPMPVIAHAVTRFPRRRLGLSPAQTLFVFLFDFRSHSVRKNPEAVVAAFRQAFPVGKERATLVLKTQGAETAPQRWEALRQLCAGDPRLRLVDLTLTHGETLGLIAASDAFVSLHRSEGFGRGPAEALLLGVPVIATDYSGTQDFLTEETAMLVDYTLTPVCAGDYPGVDGQCWAEANVATAARHMVWVHRNRAEARQRGARGRAQIERLYHPRRVGLAMLEALALPDTPALDLAS